MDEHVQGIYIRELKTQCSMALNAATALMHALEILKNNRDHRANISLEVFRAIHSFLTHTSNISRLIWPSKTKCQCEVAEREEGAVTVKCKSCLAQNRSRFIVARFNLIGKPNALKKRTMRDHLEHFDERLDEWSQSSVDRNFIADNIGPINAFGGFAPSDYMRNFDPATGVVHFRGEEYSLKKLIEATREIADAIEKAF